VRVPVDSLDLLTLSIALHRGDYLILRSAGIRTCKQLWQTESEKLEEILGSSVAKQQELRRPMAAKVFERAIENTR
jgi:hypothetical protein